MYAWVFFSFFPCLSAPPASVMNGNSIHKPTSPLVTMRHTLVDTFISCLYGNVFVRRFDYISCLPYNGHNVCRMQTCTIHVTVLACKKPCIRNKHKKGRNKSERNMYRNPIGQTPSEHELGIRTDTQRYTTFSVTENQTCTGSQAGRHTCTKDRRIEIILYLKCSSGFGARSAHIRLSPHCLLIGF